MSFRWDDAKEDYLKKRLQDDPQTPISHFQEYFGISYNAVRFKLKRMGLQIRSVRKGEVVIKPESEEEEPEEELVAEAEVKEPTAKEKKKSKEKKMREIITAKLNNLAKEMGQAASLNAQKEIQSYILALLNFNLGFNSYNSSMVDGLFYIDRDIYKDLKVPENQRGLRNGLANEILHNKLVDIQYEENYGRSRVQGD